jgi:RHS repeat-associated protein
MVAVNYLWNPPNDNVVREFDDAGAVVAEYTTEPEEFGNVISQRRDGEDDYFHYDGVGSTLAATNQAGTVTDTRSYTAFGETTEQSGTTVFPFQYVGRKGYYLDVEGSEYSVRRRHYRFTGRWLSRDLIGSAYRITAYAYASNAPVLIQDPSGLKPYQAPVDDVLLNFCITQYLVGGPLGVIAVVPLAVCFAPHVLWMRSGAGKEWTNDKYAHCMFSCRASKQCSRFFSWIGGELKEFFDCLGLGTPDAEDLKANAFGRKCAGWETFVPPGGLCGLPFREACDTCCGNKYPPFG